jgi:hypothetical protein
MTDIEIHSDWTVTFTEDARPRVKKCKDRPQARAFVGTLGRGRPEVEAALRRESSRHTLHRRQPTFQQRAVAKTLRLAREARGLSLREAAGFSGGLLSPAGLSLIERGERVPTLTSLEAIAKATRAVITLDASGVHVTQREEA